MSPRHEPRGRPAASLLAAATLAAVTGCGARSGLAGPTGACPEGRAPPGGVVFGPGEVVNAAADGCGYPVVVGTATAVLTFQGVSIAWSGDNQGSADVIDPGTPFLARLGPQPFGLAFMPQQPASHPLVRGMGAAVAGDGDVAFSAEVESPVDLGGGPVGALQGMSAIFGRFGPSGQHLHSALLAGAVDIGSPTFDAEGHMFLAGESSGGLTLNGAALGDPTARGYLVELDRQGEVVWSRSLFGIRSSPFLQEGIPSLSAAVLPDGSVVVGGNVDIGEADVGGGPFAVDGGMGFVSCFGPSGEHLWQRLVDVEVGGIHADASGLLTIVGWQDGTGVPVLYLGPDGSSAGAVELPVPDPNDLLPPLAVGPGGDVVEIEGTTSGLAAVRHDRSGQVIWARPLGAAGGLSALAAFGGGGSPVLAGSFQGTFDPGTGLLTSRPAPDGSSQPNAFVAVLPP